MQCYAYVVRAYAFVMVIGLSTGAEAAPTWADVVGDYTGALTWKSCNTPGAKKATVAIDATDGALAIDLTAAGGGLRTFTLVPQDAEGEHAWGAQDADVRVDITHTRADTIALSVDIDERCEVRGTLTRATTKLPACDRLVAWSRIEQRCTKRTGDPREGAKALAAERVLWRKQPKGTAAASCAARADKLATSLIDAGCAPPADPDAALLVPSCRRLVDQAMRVQRCTTAPPELVQLAQSLSTFAVPAPDPTSRAIASDSCEHALAVLAQHAGWARCPL